MKVALLTCLEKPLGTADDRLLAASLENLGHQVTFENWSQPLGMWSDYEMVCIRSPWDYHYHVTGFMSCLAEISKQTLLLNPLELVQWNFQKDYLLSLKSPIVPTFIFDSWGQLEKQLSELRKIASKFVLKPTVSAAARSTYVTESLLEAKRLGEEILEHSELIVQPFLESVHTDGEISLIYFKGKRGPEFSHAVLKTAKSGDFRVQTDHGGKVEQVTAPPLCREVSENCLLDLEFDWLYARVDLMDWKKNPLIGELEMIEPELFFRTDSGSALRLAKVIDQRLKID